KPRPSPFRLIDKRPRTPVVKSLPGRAPALDTACDVLWSPDITTLPDRRSVDVRRDLRSIAWTDQETRPQRGSQRARGDIALSPCYRPPARDNHVFSSRLRGSIMHRLSLLLIPILLLGCRGRGPVDIPEAGEMKKLGPGTHQQTADIPGAESVKYAIEVPASYDGKSPVPLVLALHYGYDGARPEPFTGQGMIEAF